MKYAVEPGKVRGTYITFGSQDYLVPPLNLEGFEQHEQDIATVTDPKISSMQRLTIICQVALSAIQRNYPEKDLAFVKKWVDLGNMQDVFSAVMAQSGLRSAEPGEPEGRESTGQTSTPQSLQPPVGNGSISPTT